MGYPRVLLQSHSISHSPFPKQSLEPVGSDCQSLADYEKPECHGALVRLSPENYEKVMQSEGVGANVTNPGYEEVVVTAIPYNNRKKPVQAIALRSRPHVRLRRDPCPSERYMNILKEGAAELQLKPDYQRYLSRHPVQQSPLWLKRIALNNLLFTFTVSFRLKWRGLSKVQSWFLYKAYVPSTVPQIGQVVSNLVMAFVLLPGALVGALYRVFLNATGRKIPPMIQRFVGLIEGTAPKTNETTSLD